MQPLIEDWSAAPTRPLAIKPGRSAVLQSNFLVRHCAALAHGRKVVVPGSFVLERHMPHGTWGTCLAEGRRWGCHLHSSWAQECTFIYRTSRWYRVRWAKS